MVAYRSLLFPSNAVFQYMKNLPCLTTTDFTIPLSPCGTLDTHPRRSLRLDLDLDLNPRLTTRVDHHEDDHQPNL